MQKFNALSLLRNSSSSGALSTLVALPSSRAYSTYRVKIKRHRTPKGLGNKQHHQKSFLPTENIPESTQHLFEHPDFKRENRYLVSRIDILNMGKAPANMPKVTPLSNSEWQQQMKEKVSIFLIDIHTILIVYFLLFLCFSFHHHVLSNYYHFKNDFHHRQQYVLRQYVYFILCLFHHQI